MNRNKKVNRKQIKKGLENLFLFLMSISPEKCYVANPQQTLRIIHQKNVANPQKTLNKNN